MKPFAIDLERKVLTSVGVTLDSPNQDTLFEQQKLFLKSAIIDQMNHAGLRAPISIVIERHRLEASSLTMSLMYTSQQGSTYNVTPKFGGDAEELVEQAFEFTSRLLDHLRDGP